MSSPEHSSAIACQATTTFTKGQPPGHDIIKRYTGKVDIARCVAVLKPYSSMVAEVTIELTAAAHSLVILSIQTFCSSEPSNFAKPIDSRSISQNSSVKPSKP